MAWHSFLTGKKSQKELQEKAREELIRRDERLKQNWQNYHDENSEET
jgi:hypothetical protein